MVTKKRLFALSLGLALTTPLAYGQTQPLIFDHLKCYLVKDENPRDSQVVDLLVKQDPILFSSETCKFVIKAKYLCLQAAKFIDGKPNPTLQEPAGDFACYKISCKDKEPFFPEDRKIGIADQFGQRPVKVGSEQLLCAPAEKFRLPTD